MRIARPTILHPPLGGLEGKWVAVKDGEVVAAAETMDLVLMRLHESQRPVQDAAVFRVPAEGEAELVGLG